MRLKGLLAQGPVDGALELPEGAEKFLQGGPLITQERPLRPMAERAYQMNVVIATHDISSGRTSGSLRSLLLRREDSLPAPRPSQSKGHRNRQRHCHTQQRKRCMAAILEPRLAEVVYAKHQEQDSLHPQRPSLFVLTRLTSGAFFRTLKARPLPQCIRPLFHPTHHVSPLTSASLALALRSALETAHPQHGDGCGTRTRSGRDKRANCDRQEIAAAFSVSLQWFSILYAYNAYDTAEAYACQFFSLRATLRLWLSSVRAGKLPIRSAFGSPSRRSRKLMPPLLVNTESGAAICWSPSGELPGPTTGNAVHCRLMRRAIPTPGAPSGYPKNCRTNSSRRSIPFFNVRPRP